MSEPLKAFITYSHENEQKRKKLRTYLAVMERNSKIKLRDDTDITAGGEACQEDILKEVADSDILLYLVSADSLASENCNKELTEAVRGEKRVIPIILESCDWLNDRLSDFQALPDKGDPINKWQPESDGWQNVVDGIREAVEEMQAQSDSSSETSEKELRAELAFQHGNVLMMIGQINGAIEHYSRAIELNPDNAAIYNNRGGAYVGKRDFDCAMEDYTKAIDINPNFVQAYNNRGNVYHDKGDYDHAMEDYTTAIELNPEHVNAYINRGNAYCDRGEYDIAIADHTKAIDINPNHVTAYFNRGNAYDKRGDFDRATVDYTKAIELNPRNAHAYTNRGIIYGKRSNSDHAIVDFNKAIEFKPDLAIAYTSRGNAYCDKGKHDIAIADHTKAIELNPDYVDAYNNRGNAYYDKGKHDIAIRDYTKAIELNPDYASAYYNRGNAYYNRGKHDIAIRDYTKAIELNPDYADAYCNRGSTYGNRGDFDRAIDDLNTSIRLNPNNAVTYNNRGLTYRNKGDSDRAIIDFNKAIELRADFVEAYQNRGLAYYEEGHYNRAIEDLNKAIGLNPNDANAYNNRGVAYYQKSEYGRAMADYTKAIALKPDYANIYYNRGETLLHLGEWERARLDLMTAKNMGVDVITAFCNDYKNVSDFERRNRVKLPEDIAAMLTQLRRSRFPRTEKFLRPDSTPFESPDVLNLLAKLRDGGTSLSQYVQTRPTFGIKMGRSEAFVVDSATRDQFIADHPASADILKPFLHGRDIRRWRAVKPDTWLIFTYRRIEINRYPALRKHLEKYRSALSKRAGKQKWYELPTTKSDAELFTQTKLICPNSYDHQTFAVDTDGFYCGDTCYLIPTEETWLCGLLNSRAVEWFYSQTSKQLTGDYLRARSRYIQEIPIPDLTPTQKSLIGKIVDYLIFLQRQPTTSGRDLAHARDFIMLGYLSGSSMDWFMSAIWVKNFIKEKNSSSNRW